MDLLLWCLSLSLCSPHCSQLSLLPYNSHDPPCPFPINLSPAALGLAAPGCPVHLIQRGGWCRLVVWAPLGWRQFRPAGVVSEVRKDSISP